MKTKDKVYSAHYSFPKGDGSRRQFNQQQHQTEHMLVWKTHRKASQENQLPKWKTTSPNCSQKFLCTYFTLVIVSSDFAQLNTLRGSLWHVAFPFRRLILWRVRSKNICINIPWLKKLFPFSSPKGQSKGRWYQRSLSLEKLKDGVASDRGA